MTQTLTQRSKLSLVEWIDLVLRMLFIVPVKLAINLPLAVVLALKHGLPVPAHVICAGIRVLMEVLSPRQVQLITPSTGEAYETWITSTLAKAGRPGSTAAFLLPRVKYDVEALPDGKSSILWLGDRSHATKVVLFLHGGGCVCPLDPGHLEWCRETYLLAGHEVGAEVAVALLQYTLQPAGRYPTQLSQAADALSHLLASGIRPGDIIAGGDSAGGGVVLQLLFHLLRPHPAARRIELDRPLAAVFLVSPWLTKTTSGGSFVENRGLDVVSPTICVKNFKGLLDGTSYAAEEAEGKGWALPMDADESWFGGMSTVVKELYVTAGGREVLRDKIVQVANSIRRMNPQMDVKLDVFERDSHDFIFMNGKFPLLFRTEAMQKMKAWATGVIERRE